MAINLGVTERSGNGANGKQMVPSITFDKTANVVRIDFDKPIDWLELKPDMALQLSMTLIKAAARAIPKQ